jgi:hypothetical protein
MFETIANGSMTWANFLFRYLRKVVLEVGRKRNPEMKTKKLVPNSAMPLIT